MAIQMPCCSGLVRLAQEALHNAERKISIKSIIASLKGDILSEEWL
jgi:hypothetical protein